MPISLAIVIMSFLFSQTTAAKPTLAAIYSALTGCWTGELQYHDPESQQLATVPTWLEISVSPDKGSLMFQYLYDDGSAKLVRETSRVTLDLDKNTFTISSEDGKDMDVYQMSGVAKLSPEGFGALTMTGSGTENGKKIEVRIELRIGRNDYHYLRETRLPDGPLQLRDAYTFTRRNPPQ